MTSDPAGPADWRICSTGGRTSSISKKGRGRRCKVSPPVHDDLVERDFTAVGPNELWLIDITAHWTAEGELCLCAIKDVYSEWIVGFGYSIDSRMKSRLAVSILNSATARRGKIARCILRSDRGPSYMAAVHEHGLVNVLAVPVNLGGFGDAATNFYSRRPRHFTESDVAGEQRYAEEVVTSLCQGGRSPGSASRSGFGPRMVALARPFRLSLTVAKVRRDV